MRWIHTNAQQVFVSGGNWICGGGDDFDSQRKNSLDWLSIQFLDLNLLSPLIGRSCSLAEIYKLRTFWCLLLCLLMAVVWAVDVVVVARQRWDGKMMVPMPMPKELPTTSHRARQTSVAEAAAEAAVYVHFNANAFLSFSFCALVCRLLVMRLPGHNCSLQRRQMEVRFCF